LPKANKVQINTALLKIKDAINDDNGHIQLKPRDKNENTLAELGYSPTNCFHEILGLTYKNYCDGPNSNISRSGSRKGAIWEFGKFVCGIEIYIKIQIIPTGNNNECVCISFHRAERDLIYPYA
jgi:hypothetical protein